MKKIALILGIALMFSCQKNRQKEVQSEKSIEMKELLEEKANIFKINITLRIKEDDRIDVFYTDDSEFESFNEKDRLAVNIEGSDEFQNIQFVMPKGILPYKLRIDLGDNTNRHETQVDVNSVVLEFDGNKINIEKSVLRNFFHHNIYLEENETGYIRKIVDEKYDPFIVSKAVLEKKIELEL